MEKGAIDLLMIVLEQELVECEKRRVVKRITRQGKDDKTKECLFCPESALTR